MPVKEQFIKYTERCIRNVPDVQIHIELKVDGVESTQFDDFLAGEEKKIQEEIEFKLMSDVPKLTDNEQ